MTLPVACIVDLGSNAIRFLAACPDQHGHLKVLHRDRSPIRIGEAVFSTGKAGDETQRIIDAIQHFQNLGVTLTKELITPKTHWRAVATSALREAEDRDEVIQSVQEKTQIKINILSGEQEAQWALQSVAQLDHCQDISGRGLGRREFGINLGHDDQMLRCSSFQSCPVATRIGF